MKMYRVQFYDYLDKKTAYVIAFSEKEAISEVQKVYSYGVITISELWLYNMVVI